MEENSVAFKANANGLVVVFNKDDSFESIYEQISRKLESGGFFFQTRYLAATYKGRKLSVEEEGKISKMMAEKTGAKTVLFEIDKDEIAAAKAADGAAGDQPGTPKAEPQAVEAAAAAAAKRRAATFDLDECITKYYRGTLRSGRIISYDGNVVIIGDVNPGAEVEATGNIIVLGNVRGIVHAGASGNKNASVIALNFAPTQLRVADIITRRLDRRGGSGSGLVPEIAYIKGESIVFEPLITGR